MSEDTPSQRVLVGVNSSDPSLSLKAQGLLPADLFKCHPHLPWVEKARQVGPCMMHLPLNLGDQELESRHDWGLYRDLLIETETPYVNAHMEAQVSVFPSEDWGEIRSVWLKNADIIRCHLSDWPLILENVVWRAEGGRWAKPIVDTSCLSRFLEEADAGLLLDTAHAVISCDSLKVPPEEWIGDLPLQRVKELHVTGVQMHEDRLRDSMPMGPHDWQVAEWLFRQIRTGRAAKPWLAALEYGGFGPIFEWRSDPEILLRDLTRLRGLAESVEAPQA